MRLPFWLEALRTPLSADASITGLMAMHPGRGSTFWGQPYGSPLEGWLLAPFLALPASGTLVLHWFYFALGLALVPVAFALARALDPRAALPAALLMACPSPYMLVMAALPPPRWTLGAWLHLWRSDCGPARLRRAAHTLACLALCSAPFWLPLARRPDSLGFLAPSTHRESWSENGRQLLAELHRPVGGLLGTHLMIVAGGAAAVRPVPGWVPGALLLALLAGRVLWPRRRDFPIRPGIPLWGVARTP